MNSWSLLFTAAVLLSWGCAVQQDTPCNRPATCVESIHVKYTVHFTGLGIHVNDEKVDYNLNLQGPGECYELPSSPAVVEALARPLLQSRLFKEAEKDLIHRPNQGLPYKFKIEFSDGRVMERRVWHEDLKEYPKVQEWLIASRATRKFSGFLPKE